MRLGIRLASIRENDDSRGKKIYIGITRATYDDLQKGWRVIASNSDDIGCSEPESKFGCIQQIQGMYGNMATLEWLPKASDMKFIGKLE